MSKEKKEFTPELLDEALKAFRPPGWHDPSIHDKEGPYDYSWYCSGCGMFFLSRITAQRIHKLKEFQK